MNIRSNKGFTLLELMIAAAIVSILASIAYGSYSSSVQKSRRACATAALLTISTLQERNFFQFNQYSSDVDALYGDDECPEGHYDLTLAFTSGGNACANERNCFTATATAKNVQLQDEQCRTFTIDSLNVKGATSAANADTADVCW